MKETRKGRDLWDVARHATGIVVTTNGFIKNNGQAVMGRGCAREAADRLPWLPSDLGTRLKLDGNHVHSFDRALSWVVYTFPVKHHWREPADPELISRSALELRKAVDKAFRPEEQRIVLPRPGCGNGLLAWADVKPLLEPHLDDRFVVAHK